MDSSTALQTETHRTLGGSRREPTTGQVMCTDWIVVIIISREVNFQATWKFNSITQSFR